MQKPIVHGRFRWMGLLQNDQLSKRTPHSSWSSFWRILRRVHLLEEGRSSLTVKYPKPSTRPFHHESTCHKQSINSRAFRNVVTSSGLLLSSLGLSDTQGR